MKYSEDEKSSMLGGGIAGALFIGGYFQIGWALVGGFVSGAMLFGVIDEMMDSRNKD